MQFKNLLYATALVMVTVLACQKEVSDTNLPGTNNPNTISAAITGRITNENGAPVLGALVKAGTASAQTNINGEFSISNTTVVDKAAYVTVEKSGYFTGSRTFVARANQKHYVEIELLPYTSAGTINSATGGTVTLANTSAVTLPANAVVVKSTGAAYAGTVQVAMAWIDPTSSKLIRQMPGDLRGIDEANTEVGMQSFGMLGVELTGSTGEKLQIATGKKATLSFPLPGSITGTAPATIALWSFNEATGLWKQEGTATKSGNSYIAEVGHFSFWNCDIPVPSIPFTAKFVDQNGQPLRFVHIVIKRTALNTYAGGGFTDSSGTANGWIPKNEVFVMEVSGNSACSQPVYVQSFGPYGAYVNLGTITITLSGVSNFTVTGSVLNCNSLPVTAGYVNVNLGGNFMIYRAPVINGNFTLTFSSCGAASQQITYYAVDSITAQQSTPVSATINVGNNPLGAITACGVSTQRFVNFTINGVPYNLTSPPDSITGRSSQGLTFVNAFKGAGTNSFANISFAFNGSAIGTAPINYAYVQAPTFSDSTTVTVGAFNVNVTEFGAVGSFFAGSFTGTLTGTGGTQHPITCNFRVRRDN